MGGHPEAFLARQIQHIPLQAEKEKTLLSMLLVNNHFDSIGGAGFLLRIFKRTKLLRLLILLGKGQNTVWPTDWPLALVSQGWPVPSVTSWCHGPFKSTRSQIWAKQKTKSHEWSEVTVVYILWSCVLWLLGYSETCGSIQFLHISQKKKIGQGLSICLSVFILKDYAKCLN